MRKLLAALAIVLLLAGTASAGWLNWWGKPKVGRGLKGQTTTGGFKATKPPSEAGTYYYVRAGAEGSNDGSDWTNAYTALPATLVRGETYYIADGTYGSYTFDDVESYAEYITIKKATGAAHGTSTGWDASYGDGQAIFDTASLIFSTGYYVIDGVSGGGPSSWDSGHGFVVQHTKGGNRIRFNANVDHITISHAEITNSDDTANDVNYGSLIFSYANVTDITISDCYIHNVFGCCIQTGYVGADNWTIERSKIGDNTGTASNHSDLWSAMGNDGWVWRHNYLYQWRSTGALIALNGTESGTGDDNICEDWHIYGNIFDQDGSSSTGVIKANQDGSNDQYARRWRVYNNTFIDLDSASTWVSFVIHTTGEADNSMRNNLFWSIDSIDTGNSWSDEDHNHYKLGLNGSFLTGENDSTIASDPFTDYANGDYTLSAGIAGDATIGAEYATDMLAVTRGADEVWDIGAYEYEVSP